MSVLRGGSFLQRRLTKLYTDTKSSCESVTTAPRLNDDPELVLLNQTFRTQKDRLLAWGLDWSDANAAQPNDIDEALAEAGFSDVVASIMSSIQKLLTEAERMQQPDIPKSSADGLTTGVVKTTWTDSEIARSKVLLSELTSHIDTLYDLSRSRRDMTLSMSSNTQSLSKLEKKSIYPISAEQSQTFEKPGVIRKPTIPQHEFPQNTLQLALDSSAAAPCAAPNESLLRQISPTKDYYIDRGSLYLSGERMTHASHPPPYERVAASLNSRATGQLLSSALPRFLSETVCDNLVPVLVEFSPLLTNVQNSVILPTKQRLSHLSQTLQRLVENAQVSHLGLLKFLGYFVDMTYYRYAFIFQMPSDIPFLARQPSDPAQPKPLVSLLLSGDDHQDTSVPNLEARFRLAYNLVLAFLHLRSQNLVHGNINSNNILIFPGIEVSNNGTVDSFSADLRHPYLSSPAQLQGDEKDGLPELLASGMYRHPEDRRNVTDQSAWAYDLYSLGLVLLEIGLWTPISRFWKMKYTSAMFKSRIENVYIKKLGAKCGSAYLQAVQLCLDAPNFHLSTSPMSDLGFRIPEVYPYPWNEPSKANEWDTFSKNFTYTIGKTMFRCSSLDIFAPPPEADLEESLPPPLCLDHDSLLVQEVKLQDMYPPTVEPTISIDPEYEPGLTDLGLSATKLKNNEKKVRKRTLKKWPNIEIPDHHLTCWNETLMPKLNKLLPKILKDSNESCSATLLVAGESAESAKTTICVTCANVRKVKAALKKYFEYDRENWDLIVIRGDINRSKVPRRRRKRTNKGNKTAGKTPINLNPHFQKRPLCGASIGAFRSDEHLPPVSYGGAILVDGLPYGMTVHHMLDIPDDEDDDDDCAPRSAANYLGDLTMQDPNCAYSWSAETPPETFCPFDIPEAQGDDEMSIAQSIDETFDDYWLSDGYSSDEVEDLGDSDIDDDAASVGDTVGVDPLDEPRVIVTQPAIDDVEEGFFPCAEDRDDEHLASHSLGYIHASSGLRRWTRDGIKHEVDWALIRIDSERIDPTNIVPVSSATSAPHPISGHPSSSASSQYQNLTKVAKIDDLGGLDVQSCGRTTGLQRGRISKAMSLVRMPGRQSFSVSFSVDGNFGAPGDSGAWVFDSAGRVCGHVLAWNEKSRTAYIAPMEILFEDIARTLGASSVFLPGSQEELAWHSAMATGPSPPVNFRAAAKEHLPLEFGKLALERLDESAIRPGSGPAPTGGGGGSGRGSAIKDVHVSGAPAFKNVTALMPHSRTMERPLA